MRTPFVAARQLMLLSALLVGGATAQAADHALLIGVGTYQTLIQPLQGIDLDIINMRETASLLGYDHVSELQDEQATLANIRQALKQLAKQVQPTDRVLIYFSGHGSSVPDLNSDENDKQDEAWLTYDSRLIDDDGQHLETVLVDDEVEQLLNDIPSQDIFVVLDACHSGTATKGLALSQKGVLGLADSQSKVFDYKGRLAGDGSVLRGLSRIANNRVVNFSAAADNEKSVATPKGSVFTLGLSHAIKALAQAKKQKIGLEQLRDQVLQYIQASGENPFHPQISHTDKWIQIRPITAVADNQSHLEDSRWQTFSNVAQNVDKFKVKANKQAYVIGQDSMELDMELPIDGYLNIVSIDGNDKATVLFPNSGHIDNHVNAGKFHFPTEDMTFDLPAIDQPGATLTLVLLTPKPLDSYADSTGVINAQGEVDHQFRELSAKALESMKAMSTCARMPPSSSKLVSICRPAYAAQAPAAQAKTYAAVVETQVVQK